MFSVYGITGRIFSGTLEAMDRVRPLARARSARAIAQDGEELGVEAVAAHPSQEAVRAYRAMLPEELERGPLIHAVQAMTRPAIAVRDHATAAEAWRILRDRHIRQAPVLDAADNLVGIVSERDLLTAIDLDDGEVIEPANLHLARCVCRRAERRVLSLQRKEPIGAFAVPYLNRLGDLFFVMARYENLKRKKPDVLWDSHA